MIEWATWLSDVYTNRKYVASLAGLAGKMEPDAILRRYTSTYAKNFTNFNNAKYDALIEEAKRTSNEAKQVENYKEAQKILAEEQAAIFLMDPNTVIAQKRTRRISILSITIFKFCKTILQKIRKNYVLYKKNLQNVFKCFFYWNSFFFTFRIDSRRTRNYYFRNRS